MLLQLLFVFRFISFTNRKIDHDVVIFYSSDILSVFIDVKPDEKFESRVIKLRIQKDVREVIKNSMDDESFMEKNVSANKVKLHFWVSLIDNILSRSASKGFFFSLFNQKYNLFDFNFKVYENQGIGFASHL